MNEINQDAKTVEGFGQEWTLYDQSSFPDSDRLQVFKQYFGIFPFEKLPKNAVGFDLGCGSGRWALLVAPQVGTLHCIDASSAALKVAERNLSAQKNCQFHLASVDHIPFADSSMDFGYSLGVLHHIPDTLKAMQDCTKKLKSGAPFLVYLYYSLDNRPVWFRMIWILSNLVRRVISVLPFFLKRVVTQLIALLVYFPLARFAKLVERMGLDSSLIPLSFYRNRSFYTMCTDSMDRFATRLEQRFSRKEIQSMMEKSGLEQIRFSEGEPYWCAVGIKK